MYSSFFNAHTGEKGVVLYGLYQRILGRWSDLCPDSDPDGKDQADARPDHGSLLVCSGAVLGATGFYEPLLDYAKAGASVPLLGFGNVLWEGVHDAVQEEGLLGIFKGGLTAGSAGTCAALVFGYLASLVFDSKMKK